jgi:uncharacterized membrane protein YidH (DUF202 family)
VARRRGEQPELFADVAALERTALSWERTAVGLAALGAVLLKIGGVGPVVRSVGLLLVAAAVVLVLVVIPVGYRRAHAQVVAAGPRPGLREPDALLRLGLVTTAAVVSLAALGAIVEALLLLR